MKNITIIVLVFMMLGVIIIKAVPQKKPKISNMDIELFYPLFSASLPNGPIERYLGYQKNGKDYLNFFTTSGIALEYLMKSSKEFNEVYLTKALTIIDNIENTFDRNGYFPRPAYRHFADGWVSSMDAPLIALTTLVAYELTDDKKYYEFYEKLLPYLKKTNDKHGYLLKYSDQAMFPLEYCDTNTTDDNAMYVLNGSLVGYLSLSIIADTYGDDEIEELLEKIDNAYKIKFPSFIRKHEHWSNYMLNKLTVNQGHYHIFEMKLLSSIFKVTKNQMYKNEYDVREKILKEIYDLKVKDQGNSLKYYFLRSAAPHPYVIELYGTILRFYDIDNNLIHENKCSKSGYMDLSLFKENAYMEGTLPKDVYQYELISTRRGFETKLFEEKVDDYVLETQVEYLDFDLTASGNGFIENDTLIINNELNKGPWSNVFLSFKTPFEIDYLKYYFIEFSGGIDNVAMQLTLYDESGKYLHRTLSKMIEGNNLVLFSPLGFHSDEIVNKIKKIRVRILSKKDEFKNNKNISINGFGVLDNEYEVVNYFKETNYQINCTLK